MSRVTAIQTNFTAGQLSPRLFGRVDLAKYSNGSSEITNLIVMPHGGLTRRPGTRFINETKDSDSKARLIPFQFSTIQAYCIEMGDEYMRFFKDQGTILEANKTITAITRANPGVVTSNSHGYNNGDLVFISSVVGMVEVNNKYFLVANKATNTFELTDVDGVNINTSGFTAYGSAGTAARVFEIASPYEKEDLFSIQYAQTADVMFLTHPLYAPRKLTRTDHTAWTITEIVLDDGPYLDENITTTTMNPSGTTGSITITASAVTGVNAGSGFLATDVGRIIRIGHQATKWAASTSFAVGDIRRNSGNVYECIKAGTSDGSGGPSGELDEVVDNTVTWKFIDDGGIAQGHGKITARNSSTEVAVTVVKNFAASSAETKWRLGAFSSTTGFPSAVAFFEQRLFFAGTVDQPQTIFSSRSGDFENFSPSALDDGAITVTINTDQVNSIRWLSAGQKMAIGTSGGEYTFSSSGNEEAVTPTNVRVLRQGTRGTHTTRPIRIDNRVLFIQFHQRKLRELSFDFASDSFVSPDLTILSENVTGDGLVEMTFQQEPDSVIWAVRNDGRLAGLTYLRDQEVVAWHEHVIGGNISKSFNSASSVGSNRITISSHGYVTGNSVLYDAGGNEVVGGLVDGTTYFVNVVDANTISLSASKAQSEIDAVLPLSDASSASVQNLRQDAKCETVITIPGNNEDELWMIVQRTVGGVTRRYVEVMTSKFDTFRDSSKVGAIFVDSSLTYDSTATASLSGLDHLEGETVSILGNGSVYANQTIASGAVSSLSPTVTRASIGLPYTSILTTLRPEQGGDDGAAQGRTKRVFESTFRFLDTLGAEYAPAGGSFDEIQFRTGSTPMDISPPLFSGDKTVQFHGSWETDGQLSIRQTQPLPFELTAIVTRILTHSG
tara:strand:- start:175 stop:2862 length:2688 start_codon:yes stop_codon:yes gene_type:complete